MHDGMPNVKVSKVLLPMLVICNYRVFSCVQEQIVALVCDEYKQTNHSIDCDDKRVIHDANQWVQYGTRYRKILDSMDVFATPQ